MKTTPLTKKRRFTLSKAAIVLIMGAPGLVYGQFAVNNSDIIDDIGGYWTEDISFWTDDDVNGAFDNQVNNSGLMTTRISHGSGTTDVWSMCSQYHVGFYANSSYKVTEGYGPNVSNTEVKQLDALFANVFPSFNKALALGETAKAEVLASAMQLAYWEIVDDKKDDSLVLDRNSASAGSFRVDVGYASSDADTALAIKDASQYLSNISSGRWSSGQGSAYDFYYAESTTGGQDRLWVVAAGSPVPEPSALMLLGLAGMSIVLRRRR